MYSALSKESGTSTTLETFQDARRAGKRESARAADPRVSSPTRYVTSTYALFSPHADETDCFRFLEDNAGQFSLSLSLSGVRARAQVARARRRRSARRRLRSRRPRRTFGRSCTSTAASCSFRPQVTDDPAPRRARAPKRHALPFDTRRVRESRARCVVSRRFQKNTFFRGQDSRQLWRRRGPRGVVVVVAAVGVVELGDVRVARVIVKLAAPANVVEAPRLEPKTGGPFAQVAQNAFLFHTKVLFLSLSLPLGLALFRDDDVETSEGTVYNAEGDRSELS